MKKLWKRLKSKCGESLIETLAAIVVFTLASVILLTMTTSAADLAQTNKDVAERIHADMVYAEKGPDSGGAASSGSVTFTVNSSGASVNIPVVIYRQGEGALYSYYPAGGDEA